MAPKDKKYRDALELKRTAYLSYTGPSTRLASHLRRTTNTPVMPGISLDRGRVVLAVVTTRITIG